MGVTFNGSVTFNGPMFDIHDNEHVHISTPEMSTIGNEWPHFPLNKTKDEGVKLYNFLTKNEYITASLDSWLFLMGFVTEKPEKIVPITWLTTKEQLRTMLRLSFENLINNKSIKIADLERLTPKCFVDNEGKPMNMPKAKMEYSPEIDKLKEFFRPSSDL